MAHFEGGSSIGHAIAVKRSDSALSETERYADILKPVVDEAMNTPSDRQDPKIDNNHLQPIYPDSEHRHNHADRGSLDKLSALRERNVIVDTLGYTMGYLAGIVSVKVERITQKVKNHKTR